MHAKKLTQSTYFGDQYVLSGIMVGFTISESHPAVFWITGFIRLGKLPNL